MADIQHITNHADLAAGRLLQQFQGKPNITGLIRALWGGEVQAIEDAMWGLLSQRLLDTTVGGVVLDNLGAIVGEPRNGRTDAVYRIWLAVRIAINRSAGRPDDILKIYRLLLDPSTNSLQLREQFPAAFELWIGGGLPSDLTAAEALEVLKEAKAAGVACQIVYDGFPLNQMLIGDAVNGSGNPAGITTSVGDDVGIFGAPKGLAGAGLGANAAA